MPMLLVDDALFLEHTAREPHPERPERLLAARRAIERLRQRTTIDALAPRDASDEELQRVHTPAYLEQLGRWAGKSGMVDADTFLSPRSVAAARRAAGGAVALAEALWRGAASTGIAIVRPPGHHALPDRAMGFCLLNNVAVAAAHARALGAERVAILDWDVHHGNGTEDMFYADPSVLYVSLHQAPYYPGTGAASDIGSGEGRGYTVNVPLSAGAGDAVYLAAFDRLIGPVLEAFRPDLMLVSAGFDAHERDPLGGMALTDLGYAALSRRLRGVLPERCTLGLVLEGGYDLAGLEGALEASLDALVFPAANVAVAGEHVGSARSAEIERAISAHGSSWRLG